MMDEDVSVEERSRVSHKSGRSMVSKGSTMSRQSLAESFQTFGHTVVTRTSTVMKMMGLARDYVDADPPMPDWVGSKVDQEGMETRQKRAKQKKEDICDDTLENVGRVRLLFVVSFFC